MVIQFTVKVTSDLVDIEHVRTKVKSGEKEFEAVVVNFTLKKPVSPEEARDIVDLIHAYIKEFVKPSSEIVILSGRGPIWLYMLAQHKLQHVVPSLAVFDPKIGAVITATHRWELPEEMTVLEIPAEVKSKITQ